MRSLFIVLEGIDGSGTSTQASLLKDYFNAHHQKAVISPEPSAGIIGNLIRQTLKKRVFFTENSQKFDEQMAYLFAADRHDHLYNEVDGVFKLLNDQIQVITPRYYFSSLAYNGTTPEEFEFIRKLNEKFPNPDLVVYLDLPVEVALERIGDRISLEVYENHQKLTQVRNRYLELFANYPDPCLKLEATQPPLTLHQAIVTFIESHYS